VSVRIRPVTSTDVPVVAELSTQLGYPASPAHIEARLARLARAGDRAVVLVAADADDRPLGWAHVEIRDQLVTQPAAQLMALIVADGARNRGVGAELVRAAEAWSVERGCGVMLVATRVTRVAAHRFYRRQGYALVKTSHLFEKPLPDAGGIRREAHSAGGRPASR
jgi:GNAT superfamily N-acetyltransferase